jgi:hypothetical protein
MVPGASVPSRAWALPGTKPRNIAGAFSFPCLLVASFPNLSYQAPSRYGPSPWSYRASTIVEIPLDRFSMRDRLYYQSGTFLLVGDLEGARLTETHLTGAAVLVLCKMKGCVFASALPARRLCGLPQAEVLRSSQPESQEHLASAWRRLLFVPHR